MCAYTVSVYALAYEVAAVKQISPPTGREEYLRNSLDSNKIWKPTTALTELLELLVVFLNTVHAQPSRPFVSYTSNTCRPGHCFGAVDGLFGWLQTFETDFAFNLSEIFSRK